MKKDKDYQEALGSYFEQERKELELQRRQLRAMMRERGIKRTSCFNGGLSDDEYRFNARLFEIETKLSKQG